MTTDTVAHPLVQPEAKPAAPAATGVWGNSAPLGLAAFAVTGGYMGLAVAALAAYLSCAELCEASHKRAVLPLWPLAKH